MKSRSKKSRGAITIKPEREPEREPQPAFSVDLLMEEGGSINVDAPTCDLDRCLEQLQSLCDDELVMPSSQECCSVNFQDGGKNGLQVVELIGLSVKLRKCNLL